MRRTKSIFAAIAIVLMAYAPVYAAGQAAEDHLCCLQQLRQEAAATKAHCDGMAGNESPAPAATHLLQAAQHRCERCVPATSFHSSPLSSDSAGFVTHEASETLAHSHLPAHSDASLLTNSERGPPSQSA